jgi:hypothetical protein
MQAQNFHFELGAVVMLRDPDESRLLPRAGRVIALTITPKGTYASVEWGSSSNQRRTVENELNLARAA